MAVQDGPRRYGVPVVGIVDPGMAVAGLEEAGADDGVKTLLALATSVPVSSVTVGWYHAIERTSPLLPFVPGDFLVIVESFSALALDLLSEA